MIPVVPEKQGIVRFFVDATFITLFIELCHEMPIQCSPLPKERHNHPKTFRIPIDIGDYTDLKEDIGENECYGGTIGNA